MTHHDTGFVTPLGLTTTNMTRVHVSDNRIDAKREWERVQERFGRRPGFVRCRFHKHGMICGNGVQRNELEERLRSESIVVATDLGGVDKNEPMQLTASRSESIITDQTDGDPMLHVVFVHPQIHWNTGNIGRTCLGLGARLHLIQPMGFSLDARQVRRAGLDYWNHVDVRVYSDWTRFAQGTLPKLGGKESRFFFSKFGTVCAAQMEWPQEGKIVLIFGSEVDGFDGIRDWLNTEGIDETVVAFPMVDDRFRSFNLSTTASMALWDAYKSVRIRPNINLKSGP